MKKEEGLSLARAFLQALKEKNIPVQRMLLFGSVARGEAHADSDIDIAVVCLPFKPTRMEESLELWRARRDIDVSIEPLSLRPEDFNNRLSIAREIAETGIEVR